jgi:hypothetical protein
MDEMGFVVNAGRAYMMSHTPSPAPAQSQCAVRIDELTQSFIGSANRILQDVDAELKVHFLFANITSWDVRENIAGT